MGTYLDVDGGILLVERDASSCFIGYEEDSVGGVMEALDLEKTHDILNSIIESELAGVVRHAPRASWCAAQIGFPSWTSSRPRRPSR